MAKEKVKLEEEMEEGGVEEEGLEEAKELLIGPRKMFRIFIALQGYPPGLMMDPMGENILLSLRSKTPIQKSPDLSIEKEAAGKLYWKEKSGEIIIPADNLLSCLMIAGRKVKVGRAQLSTATTSSIPGFLEIEQDVLPLLLPQTAEKCTDKSWVVDMRRAVLKKDKIPVCNIRPKFSEWATILSIKLNASEQDPSVVRSLFRIAGNSIGLCSYRPDCKGRFGRFKVVGWKEFEISDDEVSGVDFFDEHPEKLEELTHSVA